MDEQAGFATQEESEGKYVTPTIDRFDHIHVYVSDRAAAESWYERVFGFRRIDDLAFWATDGGPLVIANESGSVHIALFERPPKPNHSTIALHVSREAFLAWLPHARAELGTTLEPVDHDVCWSVYFSDPDGNPYEITSFDYDGIAQDLRQN